jgi:spore germination cell wall hydrolase CwlJ-like protein
MAPGHEAAKGVVVAVAPHIGGVAVYEAVGIVVKGALAVGNSGEYITQVVGKPNAKLTFNSKRI